LNNLFSIRKISYPHKGKYDCEYLIGLFFKEDDMGIFSRWLSKSPSLDHWCIAYIDVNPYRLRKVSERLTESGIDVHVFEDGIYVKKDQYTDAMGVIQDK
jgi:hypothetical protein